MYASLHRAFFERASDRLCVLEVLGNAVRYVCANPAETRAAGAAEQTLEGRTLEDIWPAPHAKRLAEACRRCARDHARIEFDAPSTTDGSQARHVTLDPSEIEPGRPCVLVTTRASGAEALQTDPETRLARFAEVAPGFMYSFWRRADGTAAMPFVSASIQDVFGISASAVAADANALLDLIVPEDHLVVRALAEESARTLEPLRVEFRITHPTAGLRWIALHSKPERLDDGSTVWHGVGMDTTERKRVEERLKLIDFALASVRDSVFVIDGDQIAYANDAACRALEYTPQELLGKTLYDIDPDFTPERSAAIRNQLFDIGHMTIRSRHRSKSGRLFPVEVRASSFSYGGRNLGLAIVEDIAERQRIENAMREKAAAERASTLKSEFLSRMSHELRTPLNAMLGFAQLLRADQTTPATTMQSERLDHILTAGKHLLALIDDVLDLTHIESGRMQFAREPVRVSHVAAHAIEITDSLATENGVRVVSSVDPRASAWGDERRVQQVVLNLLTNAIKYNRADGRVELTSEIDGDRLRLSVVDTGQGINAERMAHLFEPFNRLGAERSDVEGTGIGLAITRKLVEQMQGSLSVQSTPGVGSRFTVELFAAPAEPTVRLENTAQRTAASRDAKAHVVYIEDNAINALLVSEVLASRPAIVCDVATDGISGVDLVVRTLPDLVLIDMQLPDIDGEEVLRRLRGHVATAGIPCVALSANATAHDVAQARAQGFDDYLTKPLDIHAFLAWIDERFGDRPATG